MRNKLIKFFPVFIFFFAVFIFDAFSATDQMGFWQTICGVHGPTTTCPTRYKNFDRSDYYEAHVDWELFGHRHGASQIDIGVCIDPGNEAPTCQYWGCSGSGCGPEYGDEDPKNYLYGDGWTEAASPTSMRASTWFFVDDAEAWLELTGYANYDDGPAPIPGCTDPGALNYDPNATEDDGTCAYDPDVTVSCVVTDGATGLPVNIATCAIAGQSGPTNTSGIRTFSDVPIGGQTLGVTKTGYSPYSGNYSIIDDPTNLNVTLWPTSGGGSSVNCSPSSQSVVLGASVNFSAGGGSGTYSWSAPSGVPSSGPNLSNFTTSYATTGIKTVTVTRGGATSDTCSVTVNSTGGGSCADYASMISTDLPAILTLNPGEIRTFNVTFRNTGTTWWYNGGVGGNGNENSGYKLLQSSASPLTILSTAPACALNLNYGHVCPSVNKNDQRTWSFQLTAPSTPGSYPFSMQMNHADNLSPDYKDTTGAGCTGALLNPVPGRNYFGQILSSNIVVSDPTPIVNDVSISAPSVIADGSSVYYITVTSSAPGGNLSHEYALINYQGANGGQHRGYLTWYFDSVYTGWDGLKDKLVCPTGGGIAAIQAGYGEGYLELDSCSTSVSGNARTTVFTVRFNPLFATDGPLTDNDISGYAINGSTYVSGWVNFETNFSVVSPIPTVDSVTISSPTVIANSSNVYNITVTTSGPSGGANLSHQYALINLQGANGGQHRGFLSWYFNSAETSWDGFKDKLICPTGGGIAALYPGYNEGYLELDSCSTSVSGNTRTTVFTVRFNSQFFTDGPLTDNDISGYTIANGIVSGWRNFETNFNVSYPSPVADITCQNDGTGSFINGPCSVNFNSATNLRWCGSSGTLCTNAYYCRVSPGSGPSTQWGSNGDIPVSGQIITSNPSNYLAYIGNNSDFDGNGTPDIAVWRPGDGGWFVAGQTTINWGLPGDIPVPGDYDGNGTTDKAVWRSNGYWYVFGQANTQFGLSGDIPVPGDYDGDGRTDLAIYRPTANPAWFILPSSTGVFYNVFLGGGADIPVPGDYNGDGRTDVAIWRPSEGNWYIVGQSPIGWGSINDIPVPGDYNGDATTDIAVWRPSTGQWFSPRIAGSPITHGVATDIPVPGDYNGDNVTDVAFWRPSNGTWYIVNSAGNTISTGPLTTSTTYTLSCTNPAGTIQDTATVNVAAPTLTVSFSASPGTVNLGQPTDLGAVVDGTAIGTINYNIWWDCAYNTANSDPTPTVAEAQVACGDPDLVNNCSNQSLGNKCDGQGPPSGQGNRTVTYTYPTGGGKRPIIIAERGGLSAFGVAGSGVTVVVPPPVVSSATVIVNNSNYCSAGVHATVTWTYSDPSGASQAAFEVLVNGGADINITPDAAVTGLNPSNLNPELRRTGTTVASSGLLSGCNSLNGDENPQASCQMTWNTAYTAWVRVQNTLGQWSAWTRMSAYINDTNPPAAQTTWTTPVQPFPQTGFTFSPSNPAINEAISFTDTTGFSGAATPRTWLWDFDDPSGTDTTINASPPTVTNGNTTHTYTTTGSYTVRFTATDNLGQSCSVTAAPIGVQQALPQWREVAPR